jgi:hypothetical protein
MGKVFLIKAPRTKGGAQHATGLALFPMTTGKKSGKPARFFKGNKNMSRHLTTPFEEAFKEITGQDPTPANVAAALKDPNLKRQIDEQVEAILEIRELEDNEE